MSGQHSGYELLFDGRVTGEGRNPERIPLRERAASLPPLAVGDSIHTLDPGIPVRAWIYTNRLGWHQVEATAEAWTPRAARITYTDDHERVGTCWVWASGIIRRS